MPGAAHLLLLSMKGENMCQHAYLPVNSTFHHTDTKLRPSSFSLPFTVSAVGDHSPRPVFTARSVAERGIAKTSCPSVRPSVSDVEVSWSYRSEFCENNFTAD